MRRQMKPSKSLLTDCIPWTIIIPNDELENIIFGIMILGLAKWIDEISCESLKT